MVRAKDSEDEDGIDAGSADATAAGVTVDAGRTNLAARPTVPFSDTPLASPTGVRGVDSPDLEFIREPRELRGGASSGDFSGSTAPGLPIATMLNSFTQSISHSIAAMLRQQTEENDRKIAERMQALEALFESKMASLMTKDTVELRVPRGTPFIEAPCCGGAEVCADIDSSDVGATLIGGNEAPMRRHDSEPTQVTESSIADNFVDGNPLFAEGATVSMRAAVPEINSAVKLIELLDASILLSSGHPAVGTSMKQFRCERQEQLLRTRVQLFSHPREVCARLLRRRLAGMRLFCGSRPHSCFAFRPQCRSRHVDSRDFCFTSGERIPL